MGLMIYSCLDFVFGISFTQKCYCILEELTGQFLPSPSSLLFYSNILLITVIYTNHVRQSLKQYYYYLRINNTIYVYIRKKRSILRQQAETNRYYLFIFLFYIQLQLSKYYHPSFDIISQILWYIKTISIQESAEKFLS